MITATIPKHSPRTPPMHRDAEPFKRLVIGNPRFGFLRLIHARARSTRRVTPRMRFRLCAEGAAPPCSNFGPQPERGHPGHLCVRLVSSSAMMEDAGAWYLAHLDCRSTTSRSVRRWQARGNTRKTETRLHLKSRKNLRIGIVEHARPIEIRPPSGRRLNGASERHAARDRPWAISTVFSSRLLIQATEPGIEPTRQRDRGHQWRRDDGDRRDGGERSVTKRRCSQRPGHPAFLCAIKLDTRARDHDQHKAFEHAV